jgi:hypothetical protein
MIEKDQGSFLGRSDFKRFLSMLKDLDLIVTDHFDYQLLGGIVVYCLILLFVLGIT